VVAMAQGESLSAFQVLVICPTGPLEGPEADRRGYQRDGAGRQDETDPLSWSSLVFLSVFSEPADDVRRYLDGPGKGITLSVVCDPEQALLEAWSVAAAQFGIPHVFVASLRTELIGKYSESPASCRP
jgi:hypothetical protein